MSRYPAPLLPAIAGILVCARLASVTPAATLYWDGTGTAWNSASAWSTASNATTPDPPSFPIATDIASFNISTLDDATVSVSGNQSALGLVFDGSGPSILQSGAPFETLSIGASGITINSGAGTVTSNLNRINAHVAQTWTNNSANTFAVNSYISQSDIRGTAGPTLTINGSGNTILNGTVNYSSSITKNGPGTLTIAGTADNIGLGIVANAGTVVLAKDPSGLVNGAQVHAIGAYVNTIAGGTVKLAGTGDDQIWDSSDVYLTSGTFDMNGRNENFDELRIAGTGVNGQGALVNNAPGTTSLLQLQFLTLTADATIDGSGNITLSALGIGSMPPAPAGGYHLTKDGAGTLSILNSSYSGTVTTTVKAGTLAFSTTTNVTASAPITVDAGARMTTGNFALTSGPLFTLNGTLEVAPNKTFTIGAGRHFINNGAVTGTISVTGGAIAHGTGAYDVLNLVDPGALVPGASTAAGAGVVNVNTLTMTDTANAGSPVLGIEIGGTTPGTQYDQVHVTGTATFSGMLSVTLFNGFAPSAGNSFDIFDFGSGLGIFSSISLPTLSLGLSWNKSQLYTTGIISVTGVPEPTLIALTLGAVAAGFAMRRRSRS